MLVIRPRAHARLLQERAFRSLRPGTALLSAGSARVRRLGRGDRLELADGRRLRVAGVVADDLVRSAELVLRARDAGGTRDGTRQLLVATTRPGSLGRALPRSGVRRLSPLGAAPSGMPGGIARPVELKQRFGEFTVRLPYGADWIAIHPRWVARNVVSQRVPILGTVTCHRRLIAPLRRALRDLERRRLGARRRPGRLRRLLRAAADPAVGLALPARLGAGDRHQRRRQPAVRRLAPGPAAGAGDGGGRLHLGRALAYGARPDAFRASRRHAGIDRGIAASSVQ